MYFWQVQEVCMVECQLLSKYWLKACVGGVNPACLVGTVLYSTVRRVLQKETYHAVGNGRSS